MCQKIKEVSYGKFFPYGMEKLRLLSLSLLHLPHSFHHTDPLTALLHSSGQMYRILYLSVPHSGHIWAERQQSEPIRITLMEDIEEHLDTDKTARQMKSFIKNYNYMRVYVISLFVLVVFLFPAFRAYLGRKAAIRTNPHNTSPAVICHTVNPFFI